MFVSDHHLPHLLPPCAYASPEQHALELAALFEPSWHWVGAVADAPRAGDYFTLSLLGRPLVVRNDGLRHRTFLNVCAHRHSMLVARPKGRATPLTCMYHGWEYDDEGRTRKIPDAKSFRPMESRLGLKAYRTETVGPLVFMTFRDDAPSLREYLGDVYDEIAPHDPDEWRLEWSNTVEAPVNWKAAVENSLESYHINCVHKGTFKTYPKEEECWHDLHPQHTSFRTVGPNDATLVRKIDDLFVRIAGLSPDRAYKHVLRYPAFTLSYTQIFFLVQKFVPLTPSTHVTMRQLFVYRPKRRAVAKVFYPLWAAAGRSFWPQVLAEDRVIFGPLQQGLASVEHPVDGGLISVREERIFHFQQHVQQQCADWKRADHERGAGDCDATANECASACSTCSACQPSPAAADNASSASASPSSNGSSASPAGAPEGSLSVAANEGAAS